MGNGGKTKSLGPVYLKCAFAKGDQLPTRRLFHVFTKLAVKAIMGKKFLDNTKTPKEHQHRLEEVYTTAKTSLCVMHLSRPRQLMFCYVNGHLVQANPDTGSEMDLMSPSYARKMGLEVKGLGNGYRRIQFADGSTAKLLGKANASFDACDGFSKVPTGYKEHDRTFTS